MLSQVIPTQVYVYIRYLSYFLLDSCLLGKGRLAREKEKNGAAVLEEAEVV